MLADDLQLLDKDRITESTLGTALFKKFAKKPAYKEYTFKQLYRAYILAYLVRLWDNYYYLSLHTGMRANKLEGLSKDLLPANFMETRLYDTLLKIEVAIDSKPQFKGKYSIVRYLTQAFRNHLYNVHDSYKHITLGALYNPSIVKSYYALSQGLQDQTIHRDELDLMGDPVTLALVNYHYYLDTNREPELVRSFIESARGNHSREKIKALIDACMALDSNSLLMYLLANIGLTIEGFSFSYADNYLLSRHLINEAPLDVKNYAMSYAVTGSYKKESDYFICLHLATIGMYDKLFNVQLAKQLKCKAVDKDMLKEYKKIGIATDKVDRINLSYLNYKK